MHRRPAFQAFLLGVCAFVLASTAAANPPSPYAAFDAKARAELEGIAPAALPLSWRRRSWPQAKRNIEQNTGLVLPDEAGEAA